MHVQLHVCIIITTFPFQEKRRIKLKRWEQTRGKREEFLLVQTTQVKLTG